MSFLTLIAQTGISVELNPLNVLVVYGPMGVMLAWFMLRFEKMMSTLSHRFDGLTRAMLVDVLSRENVGHSTKKTAQEMLSKIAARDDKS